MAFRVCREIGCPHPNQLEKYGIGMGELMDWWAFYLYENDRSDGKKSDAEKMQMLNALKKKWGEK